MPDAPARSRPAAALIAAALALLSACGSPPSASAPTKAAAQPTDDAVAAIRALPERQRDAVFLRAVRDAGQDCQGVTEAVEVTAAVGGSTPTWQATCQGGGQWIVRVAADGSATVTSRADLREGGAR